ncbi:hypothetical protein VZT92_023005 [Zoarces viviparus]|uniref:Helix-turn-helix domain-containing protein n=1 Tax=Zoarces viviparus TaxID=48416 RepID=A0AAW1E4V4_ZOAVI
MHFLWTPTATHSPINPAINPRHTDRGCIKSQLISFHRMCTYPEHEEVTNTLFGALRLRGYSTRFVRSIKAEVSGTFISNNVATRPPGLSP